MKKGDLTVQGSAVRSGLCAVASKPRFVEGIIRPHYAEVNILIGGTITGILHDHIAPQLGSHKVLQG